MIPHNVFCVVHIEDEPSALRFIPRQLWQLIRDILPAEHRSSLRLVHPVDRYVYPNDTVITWRTKVGTYELHYWFVDDDTIDGVAEKIKGGASFILDVMRPHPDGLLKSSLGKSLRSIGPHVTNPEEQVRIFTAFGIPQHEMTKFGAHRVIMKADRVALFEYLMSRFGVVAE